MVQKCMVIVVDVYVVSYGWGLYWVDVSFYFEIVVGIVMELEVGIIIVDFLQDCYFSGSF